MNAFEENDGGIKHSGLSASPEISRRSRARKGAIVVSRFFLGQGALQAIQLLTALLLMRWLTVQEWAQFGLVMGFQLAVGTLMDLGISTTFSRRSS